MNVVIIVCTVLLSIRRYIFLSATVINFLGMDTHGLPDSAAVLHGPGYNPFVHGITSS